MSDEIYANQEPITQWLKDRGWNVEFSTFRNQRSPDARRNPYSAKITPIPVTETRARNLAEEA